MTRYQSRAAYIGDQDLRVLCPLADQEVRCDRASGDCRGCSRFGDRVVRWVCSFCTGRGEKVVPGAYSEGKCERCLRERAMLMAVPKD